MKSLLGTYRGTLRPSAAFKFLLLVLALVGCEKNVIGSGPANKPHKTSELNAVLNLLNQRCSEGNRSAECISLKADAVLQASKLRDRCRRLHDRDCESLVSLSHLSGNPPPARVCAGNNLSPECYNYRRQTREIIGRNVKHLIEHCNNSPGLAYCDKYIKRRQITKAPANNFKLDDKSDNRTAKDPSACAHKDKCPKSDGEKFHLLDPRVEYCRIKGVKDEECVRIMEQAETMVLR